MSLLDSLDDPKFQKTFVLEMDTRLRCACCNLAQYDCLATISAGDCDGVLDDRPDWCPLKSGDKVIFSKEYHGFEDCVDIGRDIHEMFDPRFNSEVEGLDPEFKGIIKIVVTYSEGEKE